MQTNFKGDHPPFIEEIQRDMKVAIEKARHIVLFGYSFPTDDFIYRSIFATYKKQNPAPKCSVINFDQHAPDNWLSGDELTAFITQHPTSEFSGICLRMRELFGTDLCVHTAKAFLLFFSKMARQVRRGSWI